MSDEKSLKTLTVVIYALQAAGAIVPLVIPWIVAVVLNYVRRDEVAGTWLESHFRWQIRTFWFGLLWIDRRRDPYPGLRRIRRALRRLDLDDLPYRQGLAQPRREEAPACGVDRV